MKGETMNVERRGTDPIVSISSGSALYLTSQASLDSALIVSHKALSYCPLHIVQPCHNHNTNRFPHLTSSTTASHMRYRDWLDRHNQ